VGSGNLSHTPPLAPTKPSGSTVRPPEFHPALRHWPRGRFVETVEVQVVGVCAVVDLARVPCDATLSLNASTPAVFVSGSTSGYLDRRSVTGGRCSLLVRVPSPLTINTTLQSLLGAGVSLDRDRPPTGSARCPLELVIEDASRRHASPLCALRQHRQRNVYQSHDSQIRLYFTHRHRDARHRHVQLPARRHQHRAAFIVKLEGRS